jgi:predicted alpha/beta-fold hydrolase
VREEFVLSDGGLMALDWTIDQDGNALPVFDKDGRPTKPILIVVPGLSGANDNLYTVSVWQKARKLGYNCCTVIFRGCAGLPLKTAKLSYPSYHKDMEECVKYIYDKYV